MASERIRRPVTPHQQETPPGEPAPLEAKADQDLLEVSAEEGRTPSDPEVKDRAVRRLERATPEGVGAQMEPRRLPWWMISLPVMSFVIGLAITVWLLSSAGSAMLALCIGFGFVILSNAPLIGALWMRQRDRRHLEKTVDDEARKLDRDAYRSATTSVMR